MISEILLRRKNGLTIEAAKSGLQAADQNMIWRYVAAISKNIEALGYRFDAEVVKTLGTHSVKWLEEFYNELIPMLKKLRGADVAYRPMYPNFPKQVADASDAELYLNAIIHYISFGNLLPDYEKNVRLPLIDKNDDKITVLSLTKPANLGDFLSSILSSKTSISEQDAEDVREIMKSFPDFQKYLPDVIPLKENVALVAKTLLGISGGRDYECITKYFKTATDVLRFIVSLSDGDTSLAERSQFKHLSRPERRMVMNLLTGCGAIAEDMYRYRDEWIRIGEILHPFTYQGKKYSDVIKAFKTLRGDKKPLYLMGKVEREIAEGNVMEAAALLQSRPGDFARRMDKLLRSAKDVAQQFAIIEAFTRVIDKVSTPVLLQLRQTFIGRLNGNPKVRVFFPKGNTAKVLSVPYNLPKIEAGVCKSVVTICDVALRNGYRQRDPMGLVYIDEDLKNYIVPFSQRSASSGNKILVRGSKVSVSKDTKAIRGFIWWTNTENDSRVDIDLSACVLDANFNYLTHVSYTNLRDGRIRAYHSGDIINGGSPRGKGVAEFLDTDIDGVLGIGGRYICYQVYSYTGQKFNTLPNCRFGWMERQDVHSGEIFEPSTVEMMIQLQANSNAAIPVLFDCVERKYIWMDLAGSIDRFGSRRLNNLESNLTGVTAATYSIVNINKTSMYDLVKLNALARGCIVDDRNMADVIFSNDTTKPVVKEIDENGVEVVKERDVPIITAYDVDYYMGRLL